MLNKKFSNFINHNHKYFNFLKYNSKNKILVEFNNWSSLHISSSYLLKCLQERHKSDIYAYSAQPLVSRPLLMSPIQKFKWFFGKIFSLKFFGIYKSIGVKNFIYPKLNKKINHESKNIYKRIIKKIKNNNDVENIKINNIEIGDLIYDSYLKYYSAETIDITDQKFLRYLEESISIFLFWKNYFNENNVKAVVLSHTVYLLGFLSRIAIKKKIKVYVCHPDYINCLNKKIPFARYEFINAKKNLRKIPNNILKIGLSHATKRIDHHIKGKKIDIWWTIKNPFDGRTKKRVLNKNKKFKYLIASHSFLDSPHAYGKNLFPDNYLWLDFIGKNTVNSDSEYYLKIHPYGNEFEKQFTNDVIKNFIKKYPHIKLLPTNIGHKQLIKEGIDCVLTVIGSIGFEYPLFGIPVINASTKNATINFDFNIHLKSIAKFKSLLLNPKKINVKIRKKEILEYYFMRHIYYPRNWLFDNIQKVEQIYGAYSLDIYNYWLNREFKEHRHLKILNNLKKFIDSNNYILDYKFMDRNILDDIKTMNKNL